MFFFFLFPPFCPLNINYISPSGMQLHTIIACCLLSCCHLTFFCGHCFHRLRLLYHLSPLYPFSHSAFCDFILHLFSTVFTSSPPSLFIWQWETRMTWITWREVSVVRLPSSISFFRLASCMFSDLLIATHLPFLSWKVFLFLRFIIEHLFLKSNQES